MTAAMMLWAGVAALVLAFLAAVAVALMPRRLPLSRRRLGAEAKPSALGPLADAATSATRRLMGHREGRIADSLRLAGVKQRPQDFLVLVGAAVLLLFALGLVVQGPLAAVLFALLALVGAWYLVRVRTERRRKAFAAQLDETLQILAGSLRAGYSLPQAASTVAAESPEPTSEMFTQAINEARVGRPLVEALEEAARRMQNDDFFWVVQAISINREVGGNLADVLEGVGTTIRERIHLKRQVGALAAEGKLSAVILCVMPPAILVFLSFSNPKYVGKFGESLLGMAILGVGAAMLLIGILWMRAMVRIKF